VSRTTGYALLCNEVVLLAVLTAIGDVVRRRFSSPADWHLVLVEFGMWFVVAVLLGFVAYWAARMKGMRVWSSVATVLAILVTWPLRALFLPFPLGFGDRLIFQIGVFLIVYMPIGWALDRDTKLEGYGRESN
jgi:hypothetical protein